MPGNRVRTSETKHLYDQRSAVIHGGSADVEPEDVELAEKLTRTALRLFIGYYLNGERKTDVVKDMEQINLGTRKKFPDYAYQLLDTPK